MHRALLAKPSSLLSLPALLLLAPLLAACDGAGSAPADPLVEDASFSAALEDGVGDALDGVTLMTASVEAAAEEDLDAELLGHGDYLPHCSLAAHRRRVIEEYDQDGNGVLSPEEREALRRDFAPRPFRRHRYARFHRLARLRWIYDVDESGGLDEAERAALRADLEARCANRRARLLDAFDEDMDGQLAPEEREAAVQAVRERRRQLRQALLDEYDANGDGLLGPLERFAARGDRVERILERRTAVRDAFDGDQSGDLDFEERSALREALRARVRGEHFGEEEELP